MAVDGKWIGIGAKKKSEPCDPLFFWKYEKKLVLVDCGCTVECYVFLTEVAEVTVVDF